MKPELRFAKLPPSRKAKPAIAGNSPSELVHRLEILNCERKALIRELVMSAVAESLGNEPLPLDRTGLVDLMMMQVATLSPRMGGRLLRLVPSIVDFYLRECGVGK